MKVEVTKKAQGANQKSLVIPIVYLLLGLILAFKSNEATTLLFWIIGLFVIVYGLKNLYLYWKNKELLQYKNINLSIAIISIVIGVLLMILASALEIGLRYVLGFFLIYFGISRLLTSITLNDYMNIRSLSNILLIIMGIFSIFVSNAIFVVVGWLLILNAALLFWDYIK